MNNSTISIAFVSVCLFGCVLPLPCHAQQAQDRILLDYPKTLHPGGWKIEGYAFGTRNPDPKLKQAAQRPTRNQRQYQSGRMTSPEFVIDTDFMQVVCSGVFHPTLVAVTLTVDGKDVRSCSPEPGCGFLGVDASPGAEPARLWQAPIPGEHWFDLRALKGKRARIEVHDSHANGLLEEVKIDAIGISRSRRVEYVRLAERRYPAGDRGLYRLARNGWNRQDSDAMHRLQ